MTDIQTFEAAAEAPAERVEGAFVVDLDVFEGPLDLLLDLARREKVDLAKISIARLAEQYLIFIEEARKLKLELAADYLVMAAWLAYLKSRLLLPQAEKADELSGEEMAALLAHRLRRLEAMRNAAEALSARDRLGRDVFKRGAPEGVRIDRKSIWDATLYDLLTAYAQQRQTTHAGPCHDPPPAGAAAGRGARGSGAAGRHDHGLDGARCAADLVPGAARGTEKLARLDLQREPGTGQGRPCAIAAGEALRAALPARTGGECVR